MPVRTARSIGRPVRKDGWKRKSAGKKGAFGGAKKVLDVRREKAYICFFGNGGVGF